MERSMAIGSIAPWVTPDDAREAEVLGHGGLAVDALSNAIAMRRCIPCRRCCCH